MLTLSVLSLGQVVIPSGLAGASWAVLVALWALLGRSWGALGALLGVFWWAWGSIWDRFCVDFWSSWVQSAALLAAPGVLDPIAFLPSETLFGHALGGGRTEL